VRDCSAMAGASCTCRAVLFDDRRFSRGVEPTGGQRTQLRSELIARKRTALARAAVRPAPCPALGHRLRLRPLPLIGTTGILPKGCHCSGVSAKRRRPDARSPTRWRRDKRHHLVLRGLAPVRRTSGQRHVLWVISHPGRSPSRTVTARIVLVASTRFASARARPQVEVFLQRLAGGSGQVRESCTPTCRDCRRGARRDAPDRRDALAAGIRPAIYGGG
jgi:hypothetical protein